MPRTRPGRRGPACARAFASAPPRRPASAPPGAPGPAAPGPAAPGPAAPGPAAPPPPSARPDSADGSAQRLGDLVSDRIDTVGAQPGRHPQDDVGRAQSGRRESAGKRLAP
jgi:hypothetical protein